MECENCGSTNVWSQNEEGDTLVKCFDCDETIENGILTQKGKSFL